MSVVSLDLTNQRAALSHWQKMQTLYIYWLNKPLIVATVPNQFTTM